MCHIAALHIFFRPPLVLGLEHRSATPSQDLAILFPHSINHVGEVPMGSFCVARACAPFLDGCASFLDIRHEVSLTGASFALWTQWVGHAFAMLHASSVAPQF